MIFYHFETPRGPDEGGGPGEIAAERPTAPLLAPFAAAEGGCFLKKNIWDISRDHYIIPFRGNQTIHKYGNFGGISPYEKCIFLGW